MRGRLAITLIVIAHTIAQAQSLPTFITSAALTIDDSIGDTTRTSSRLTDAKRLSDGRIVAAVCGANELRGYDATGKRFTTLAIPNSPARERLLWRLFPAGGDTLGAYLGLNSGVTLVDPQLQIVRALTLPNPDTTTFQGRPRATRLDVIGRFTDGTFLGRLQANPSADTGFHRRRLSFYRFDNSGRILDSITVAGREDRVTAGQRVGQAIRMGRVTASAIAGDRLVIADQTTPFLAEHGTDLKPARRVPTLSKPVAVTDSVREAWTRLAVDRAMMPANGVLATFGDFYPDSTPAFGDIVTGTDGRTWVQDPLGADHYPLIWTAYQGGRAVARAELPPRFYPTQFGRDWVLGLAYDRTPVDRVQLLTLKPGPLTGARLTPKDAAPANRPRCGAWNSR